MKRITLTNEQIADVSGQVLVLIKSHKYNEAVDKLVPVLDSKIPFSQLDKIAISIGRSLQTDYETLFEFIDHLISTDAMGSYVIAGFSMTPLIDLNLKEMLDQTRKIIIKGNVWHVCDNVSERTIGPALVKNFDATLPYVRAFLKDDNYWIKRSAGVAIHFFNKRIKDRGDLSLRLLEETEPYLEIKQRDVVKGIGWGIKTTGKYHPGITTDFMVEQLKKEKDLPKLLLKKSLTYLPQKNRNQILKYV